jgi:hypothetical protein
MTLPRWYVANTRVAEVFSNSEIMSRYVPIYVNMSKLLKPLRRYVNESTVRYPFKYLPLTRSDTVRESVKASKSGKDISSRGGTKMNSSLLSRAMKNNITRKLAEAEEDDRVYNVSEILGSSRMFEATEAI